MAKQGEIFRIEQVRYPGRDYFDSSKIKALVYKAMEDEGEVMKKELYSTVEYWRHRPRFNKYMHIIGTDVYLEVAPVGTNLAVKYWEYVNKGTAYRFAIFHPFYEPKTQVDSHGGSFFTNTPGRYTVTIKRGGTYTSDSKIQRLSKKRIRRGIRPRKWIELLREKHRNTFALAINRAIEKGLRTR